MYLGNWNLPRKKANSSPLKSNFLIPISLKADGLTLWKFKLLLFHLAWFIVWNIKGLHDWVAQTSRLDHWSLQQVISSSEPENFKISGSEECRKTKEKIKTFKKEIESLSQTLIF